MALKTDYGTLNGKGWALAILGGLGAIVGFILLLLVATNFRSVDVNEVCVVKEGGPFDGRNVAEIRQPSEGPKFIGTFNSQQCFPATERQVRFTDNDQGDRDAAAFRTPTLDAVNVHVDGQARFVLATDSEVFKDFYRRYGTRTFDGKKAYEGDEGWTNFLAAVFVPVLQNTIREVVGDYRCIELNNQCQYVQNIEAATKGDVKEVHQNLDIVGQKIAEKLVDNLNSALGNNYFERVRFNIIRVGFDSDVQREITGSQAKRAELAKAELEAQRQQREAHGKLLVAQENAKAIQVKAQSYQNNQFQAKIDLAEALCGSGGCQNLQVLGGADVTKLIK